VRKKRKGEGGGDEGKVRKAAETWGAYNGGEKERVEGRGGKVERIKQLIATIY